MNVLFKKCSLEEFGQILRSGDIEELRASQGVLIESPVVQFGNHIFNMFAPKDHVLWNFDFYSRFRSSEHAFYQRYLHPEFSENVDKSLKKIVQSAGFPCKSDFSVTMMGGWMNRIQFFPKPLHFKPLNSMHRHFSVVVPDSRIEMVRQHFLQQAELFPDSAFFRYDERLPDPSRFDDLMKTDKWILFAQSPEYLQEEKDKSFLYDEAERYMSDPNAFQELVSHLDPRWGIRGIIRLQGIVDKSKIQGVNLERFGNILRFHLNVALRICSFSTLARMAFHEIGLGQGIYPDGIKEELLRKIANELLPYKEIVDFDLNLPVPTPVYHDLSRH